MLKHLLTEKSPTLTKAINTALGLEAADRSARHLQSHNDQVGHMETGRTEQTGLKHLNPVTIVLRVVIHLEHVAYLGQSVGDGEKEGTFIVHVGMRGADIIHMGVRSKVRQQYTWSYRSSFVQVMIQ